ncbi:MAG: D-alanyl-D-alanine carboxypeptidase/D-alanyl-D-alanine-endopeptidase [Propioniciclava sp.]
MAAGVRRGSVLAVWLAAVCALGGAVVVALPVADAVDADPRVGGRTAPVEVAAPPTALLEPLPVADPVTAAALKQRFAALPDPGGPWLAAVADARTGEVLYEHGDGTSAPASSMKVLSGLVALDVLGPDTTFATTTGLSADGTLVLTGGGDPLLTSTAVADYPRPASLAELARRTAAALGEAGTGQVRLAYDSHRFGGPAWNPAWSDIFAWSVAPITALTVDHGRVDPPGANRAENPARLAARRFAAALAEEGIEVTEVVAAPAGIASDELASVVSPPVSTLVEQSLLTSDNDVAETLTWQVALARGEPATPRSAARVLATELKRLGLWNDGMRVVDGNGIASTNAVTPTALAGAVRLGLTEDRLRAVVTGLPVAGLTGTLENRFDAKAARGGRGLVRAKTGTIRGVNTLTGYVVTADGQTLVFSFLVSGAGQTTARAWLDRAATTLATCGC